MNRKNMVLVACTAIIAVSAGNACAKSANLSIVYRTVGQSYNKVLPVFVETSLSTTKTQMMCVPGTCVANVSATLPGYDYAIYYALFQGKDASGWLPEGQLIVNGLAVTARLVTTLTDHAGWRAHILKKDGTVANITSGSIGFEATPNQQIVEIEVDAYMTGGCASNPQFKGDANFWSTRPMDVTAFRQMPTMASWTTQIGIPSEPTVGLDSWFQIIDGNTGKTVPPTCMEVRVTRVPCWLVPYDSHKDQYHLIIGPKGMQNCSALMP